MCLFSPHPCPSSFHIPTLYLKPAIHLVYYTDDKQQTGNFINMWTKLSNPKLLAMSTTTVGHPNIVQAHNQKYVPSNEFISLLMKQLNERKKVLKKMIKVLYMLD